MMKTKIAIIGAGPAGLILARILYLRGIECIVFEAKSRDYCEQRIRAGILEQSTVDLLRKAGAADRLDREAVLHHSIDIGYQGKINQIEIAPYLPETCITAYGQTEITKDLFNILIADNVPILFETPISHISEQDSKMPKIHYSEAGVSKEMACDFVAGCDGFWGIVRDAFPKELFQTYHHTYPYSWLGIMADAPPKYEVVVYTHHPKGFALHSMRSTDVSRLYFQVDNDDSVDNWSDDAIWQALEERMGVGLNRGAITQKSITPMRSFMVNMMRNHNVFIAGDAAHIVPPTGAKGLNLAFADIALLSACFIAYYQNDNDTDLQSYSALALDRIWKTQRFSNYCTHLLHKDKNKLEFDYKLQQAEIEYLLSSSAAQHSFVENYTGLPIARFPDI